MLKKSLTLELNNSTRFYIPLTQPIKYILQCNFSLRKIFKKKALLLEPTSNG